MARRILKRVADAARVLWRGCGCCSSPLPATGAPTPTPSRRSRDLNMKEVKEAVKEVLEESDRSSKGSGKSKFRETFEVVVSSFTTVTCVSLLMGYTQKSNALATEESKNAVLSAENQRLRDTIAAQQTKPKSWLSWFRG